MKKSTYQCENCPIKTGRILHCLKVMMTKFKNSLNQDIFPLFVVFNDPHMSWKRFCDTCHLQFFEYRPNFQDVFEKFSNTPSIIIKTKKIELQENVTQ